jgi:chorismate mutase
MAEASKSEAKPEHVEEQIQQIRAEVSKLTDILTDLAGSRLDSAKAAAKGQADQFAQRSRDAAASVEDYVREKPIQSAVAALLLGIFVGAMTRR